MPEKSHGQRSLVSYSPEGHKELDMTEDKCKTLSGPKGEYLRSPEEDAKGCIMEKKIPELRVKTLIAITKTVGMGKMEKGKYVPGRELSMEKVTVV